jgi:hypothetical protein
MPRFGAGKAKGETTTVLSESPGQREDIARDRHTIFSGKSVLVSAAVLGRFLARSSRFLVRIDAFVRLVQ